MQYDHSHLEVQDWNWELIHISHVFQKLITKSCRNHYGHNSEKSKYEYICILLCPKSSSIYSMSNTSTVFSSHFAFSILSNQLQAHSCKIKCIKWHHFDIVHPVVYKYRHQMKRELSKRLQMCKYKKSWILPAIINEKRREVVTASNQNAYDRK